MDSKNYRALWLPELLVFSLVVLALSALFYLTGIDLKIESAFYRSATGWFLQDNALVRFAYHYSTWPAFLTALLAAFVLVAGYFKAKLRKYRIDAIFLLLVLLIGPGILINSLLKVHCGRPRPAEVKQFGGNWDYRGPLYKGQGGKGRSFPCGHCSMGFYFITFYFILNRSGPGRKRKRLPPTAILAAALAYGSLIGLARMSSGGHFLSDVAWSAFILYGTSFAVYYFVLQIPRRDCAMENRDAIMENADTAMPVKGKPATLIAALIVLSTLVVGLMLATPVYEEVYHALAIDGWKNNIYLNCTKCNLILKFANTTAAKAGTSNGVHTGTDGMALSIKGVAEGFGLPGNEVKHVLRGEELNGKVRNLRFDLTDEGLYLDLYTDLVAVVDVGSTNAVYVKIGHGDVMVTDTGTGTVIPHTRIDVPDGKVTIGRDVKGKIEVLSK